MGFCDVHNWREMTDCPECRRVRDLAWPTAAPAPGEPAILNDAKAQSIREINRDHPDMPEWERMHGAVQAQIDGDPLEFVISPDVTVPLAVLVDMRDKLNTLIGEPAAGVEISSETNFGFYVDGYTLRPTESIHEIELASMDGRRVTLRTSVLTQFFERRLPQDGNQS